MGCKKEDCGRNNGFLCSLISCTRFQFRFFSLFVCFSGRTYVDHHAGTELEAAASSHPKSVRAGESATAGGGPLPLGKKTPGF